MNSMILIHEAMQDKGDKEHVSIDVISMPLPSRHLDGQHYMFQKTYKRKKIRSHKPSGNINI